MAGYSGTPLPKKLGIKDAFRAALPGIPPEVKKELADAFRSCQIVDGGGKDLDFVHLFVKTQAELKKSFASWARKLQPAGILWVSWPKKTSGVVSDLDENRVRDIGLAAGLVDVKVCAVSDVWSGLKFVIRVKNRK